MTELKIAALLTIHNRIDQTLKCLELLNKNLSKHFTIDVFITDSGTTDSSIIIKNFSNCVIQKISNDVYWNQGMIIAWELAINSNKNYNFFLLLNDDTFLKPRALSILLNDFKSVKSKDIIIVGSTSYKKKISYGGRNNLNSKPILPNGQPQKAKFMNGNCVLIPYSVYLKVGNLNKRYSHSLGDIDYAIRARKKGVNVLLASEIIGQCKPNKLFWYQNKNIVDRFRELSNPKGLPFFEYLYFNIYNLGALRGLIFILSTMIIILNPKIYEKVKSL